MPKKTDLGTGYSISPEEFRQWQEESGREALDRFLVRFFQVVLTILLLLIWSPLGGGVPGATAATDLLAGLFLGFLVAWPMWLPARLIVSTLRAGWRLLGWLAAKRTPPQGSFGRSPATTSR